MRQKVELPVIESVAPSVKPSIVDAWISLE